MAAEFIRRTPKMDLISVVTGLRYFGLGAKVAKRGFDHPDSYWVITKVNFSKDQQSIASLGATLMWKGRISRHASKLGDTLIKQWVLLEVPDYSKFRGTDRDRKGLLQEMEMKSQEINAALKDARAAAALSNNQPVSK
jgi:hypothetical protein